MNKIILIFFYFILLFNKSFAQTDTVYIIKTDTVFVMEKQDRLYKFFVENKEADINCLWKMNLTNVSVFLLNIGYEKRIIRSFTAESYFRLGGYLNELSLNSINSSGSLYSNHKTPSEFHSSSVTIEFEQLLKFYYNLNRREKLGKKTNGFSGNYLAVSFLFKKFQDPEIEYENNCPGNTRNFNLGIKYGVQRRVGKLGYIEAYAGLYYRWESIYWDYYDTSTPTLDSYMWTEHKNYFVPVIGIKAGFAISSFDYLRRMIKD